MRELKRLEKSNEQQPGEIAPSCQNDLGDESCLLALHTCAQSCESAFTLRHAINCPNDRCISSRNSRPYGEMTLHVQARPVSHVRGGGPRGCEWCPQVTPSRAHIWRHSRTCPGADLLLGRRSGHLRKLQQARPLLPQTRTCVPAATAAARRAQQRATLGRVTKGRRQTLPAAQRGPWTRPAAQRNPVPRRTPSTGVRAMPAPGAPPSGTVRLLPRHLSMKRLLVHEEPAQPASFVDHLDPHLGGCIVWGGAVSHVQHPVRPGASRQARHVRLTAVGLAAQS